MMLWIWFLVFYPRMIVKHIVEHRRIFPGNSFPGICLPVLCLELPQASVRQPETYVSRGYVIGKYKSGLDESGKCMMKWIPFHLKIIGTDQNRKHVIIYLYKIFEIFT